MFKAAISTVLLLTAVSCQAILGIEDPIPARDGAVADAPSTDTPTADADPGADAVSGTDGACEPVILVAAKIYQPAIDWCHDERNLSAPISFQLPAELVTTDGTPGNHCAQLSFTYGNDPAACIYKGDISMYRLAECRTGDTISFNECGGSDVGVLVNLSPSTLIVTDTIRLQVHNGDPNHGRTEVTLELTGTCNPDGTTSMCIGWNG